MLTSKNLVSLQTKRNLLIPVPDTIQNNEPNHEIDFNFGGVEYLFAFNGKIKFVDELVDVENGRQETIALPEVTQVNIERVLLCPEDKEDYQLVEELPLNIFNKIKGLITSYMVQSPDEFIYHSEPIFENQ